MKAKWLIDFLCRWLGHDWEFIRDERRDGFFGEALCIEYECRRCHKTEVSITESFSKLNLFQCKPNQTKKKIGGKMSEDERRYQTYILKKAIYACVDSVGSR